MKCLNLCRDYKYHAYINSAVVDSSNQVFSSTRPGLLNDVFGIRLGSYEEIENMNEISPIFYTGKKVQVNYKGNNIESESPRFDIIEPKGAEVLGNITSLDKKYPVITSNIYGKGRAINIGLPARNEILRPLVEDLISELSITQGPDVPEGVMARQIDEKHFLYLNVSSEPKEIQIKGNSRSILFDKDYTGKFTIEPYEPEFIELK
jgi:beta-galactosidase